MAEPINSKGKRIVVFSILVFVVALVGAAIAGGAATGISDLQTHTTVLSANSQVDYVYGAHNNTVTNLSFAAVNGTTTVENDYTYTYQKVVSTTTNNTTTNTTVNATGTGYPVTDYLLTNMTLGEMNLHSVNKLNITTNVAVNATLVIGYGTSYNDFVPISASSYTAKTNTTADFSYKIGPASLTGNQSQYFMFELELSNKSTPATYTISVQTTGIASGLYNYQTGLDIGYVLDGVLILAFAVLTLPHYDLNINKAKPAATVMTVSTKKGGHKKGGK
jgi:hypothetical protein